MRVLVKVDKLNQMQRDLGLTDQEFAEHIGVSRSQLWRAKRLPTDKRFSLGQDFIAKILNKFPDKPFEYFFFLDQTSHVCDGLAKKDSKEAI